MRTLFEIDESRKEELRVRLPALREGLCQPILAQIPDSPREGTLFSTSLVLFFFLACHNHLQEITLVKKIDSFYFILSLLFRFRNCSTLQMGVNLKAAWNNNEKN